MSWVVVFWKTTCSKNATNDSTANKYTKQSNDRNFVAIHYIRQLSGHDSVNLRPLVPKYGAVLRKITNSKKVPVTFVIGNLEVDRVQYIVSAKMQAQRCKFLTKYLLAQKQISS